MNWHDTIVSIRSKPEYIELVKQAYFDENLILNVERFKESEEFKKTLDLFKELAPNAKKILDVGAGNGISSITFGLCGYEVTVVEPDASDSVGAGAIRQLKEHYQLTSMTIYEEFAENIGFEAGSFDIVYVRQAMHHAYDLSKFVKECARVLKRDGFLFTIRDHVIYDKKDKEWFLKEHPLHKFYGGENAFTTDEYKQAMTNAGLQIVKELKFFDSVINYFPISTDYVEHFEEYQQNALKKKLKNKVGFLAAVPGMLNLYKARQKNSGKLNEKSIAGRMYSYISKKL